MKLIFSFARRLSRVPIPSPPLPRRHLSYGFSCGELVPVGDNTWRRSPNRPPVRYCSTSEASKDQENPTESVKEMHDKILKSVEAKSTPPNAWLWSLIDSCSNKEDVKLLFDTLENLRRFRLSALRIHDDFNEHLCERVAQSCARVDAFDYGLKALWKHNVYGLVPSVASANQLLRHAKEKNDSIFMRRIMWVMQKNKLPLQPSTADLVFSICYNKNKWDLISAYSRKFMNARVKLHRSTFDTWMEFAANRGEVTTLWKIEKLRSNSVKHQTASSTFSCAKGFLLEKKAESAATVIHVLNQSLPENKKPDMTKELQKLAEWPSKVVKHQKEDRKALASSLKKEISKMVECLMSMGLEVTLSLEENEHEGKIVT